MTLYEAHIVNRLRRGNWLIRRGNRWNWTNGTFEIISGRGVHSATVDRLAAANLIEIGEDGKVARAHQQMSKGEIITRLNDITADLLAEIDQLKRERDDLRASLEKELLDVYRERACLRALLAAKEEPGSE